MKRLMFLTLLAAVLLSACDKKTAVEQKENWTVSLVDNMTTSTSATEMENATKAMATNTDFTANETQEITIPMSDLGFDTNYSPLSDIICYMLLNTTQRWE